MTQNNKKADVLNKIKNAVLGYDLLLNNTYLIVFEGNYIEITFFKKNYKHLTGVMSSLSAEDFYNKAKNRQLSENQIFFSKNHPYRTCKDKLYYLDNVDKLFLSDFFVVENVTTLTRSYKLGFTDLNYSMLFTENTDNFGNRINEVLIPASIRVREDEFDKSSAQYSADFVFKKQNDINEKYKELIFGDLRKINEIPDEIKKLISLD